MSQRVASFHHCRTPGVSGQMCRVAGSVKASYHSSVREGISSSVAGSRVKKLDVVILWGEMIAGAVRWLSLAGGLSKQKEALVVSCGLIEF